MPEEIGLGEVLNIEVKWPKSAKLAARTITVHLHIEPVVRAYIGGGVLSSGLERSSLSVSDLVSRDSLLKALANLTRAKPDKATIDAICMDEDEPDLLERLGITGPPPNPIIVDLPNIA
jgi:hypothetical protein